MAIFYFLGIVLILLIIGDWFRVKRRQKKYMAGFTIPPCNKPLLGLALEFSSPKDFFKVGYKFSLNYGSKMWCNLLFLEFAFIRDPDLIEAMMTSKKFLSKSAEYQLLEKWLGKGLLTSDGEKWKKDRRFLTPAFHFNNLDQFVKCFNTQGNIFINKLKKEIGKDIVDVFPFITLYTLDVICDAVMETFVNAQKNENVKYVWAINYLTTSVMRRTLNIWKLIDLLYMLSPDYWTERKALKIAHDFTNSVIMKRREYLLNNPDLYNNNKKCTSFLDMLLMGTIDGKPLTNNEIREQVDTFMFEGHDTTASAIRSALYYLSKNMDCQEKAYNEIKSLVGDDKNCNLTWNQLNEMPYLTMVIKETLRLAPSVPIIARTVKEDVEINGTLFPKGSHVLIGIFEMQHDYRLFNKPEEFIPERFLKENESTHHIYSYIPFSAGYRNCIGQKFAMTEMKSILAKVLMNFKLRSVEYLPTLISDIILRTSNGCQVRLELRE